MTDNDKIPPMIRKRRAIARSGEDLPTERWEKVCERPEGLLTDKQRRFLQGVMEYTGDNARQERYGMRQRIRRRYVQGIQDLSFLRSLDKGSCETIISELSEPALSQLAAELLEFIYVQTGNKDLLNKSHETAVYNALRDNPELRDSSSAPLNVKISIEIEYPRDINEIKEQAEEMGVGSLQPEEAGYLIQNLNPVILELYQNAFDKYLEQSDADLEQLNEINVDVAELFESDEEDNDE